jgi:hypothetical protein
MAELIQEGAPNIVCMQPFACLPNHITGKGVMKALKERYPHANIAAIDYDSGASEINQLNRIKLMLAVAFKNARRDSEAEDSDRAPATSDEPVDYFKRCVTAAEKLLPESSPSQAAPAVSIPWPLSLVAIASVRLP